MDKKNKIILCMIIIMILIIILLGMILLLNKKNPDNIISGNNISNNTNVVYNNTQTSEQMPKDGDYSNIPYSNEINNKLEYVNNRSDYFTMVSIVDNYISILENKNENKLMSILSPEYINKYNITKNNIFDKLTVPEKDNNYQYYKYTVTDMTTVQLDSSTSLYIVNGKCRIVGKNIIFSIKAMIEVDSVNKLYNLYPYQYIQDNGIDKIKIGEVVSNYNKEDINNRNNNTFSYIKVEDDEMVNKYFENLKELLLYYKDDAYNKLDSEYSSKRFSSKNEFESYLIDNKETIQLMQLSKYGIETNNNYIDYKCVDRYNNTYIFREQNGIMRYSFFLDNYTILPESTKKEYKDATELSKSKYQVEALIQKINAKDYKSIYNNLDSTFKNNNFKTIEALKTYINKNFYYLNDLSIIDIYQEENYNLFKCKIINLRNNNESKEITVVVSIKDGMNYTMSFSFE